MPISFKREVAAFAMSEKKRQIVYVQYTNPSAYPPLEHSSRLLAERGWQVRFAGTRSRGNSDDLRFAEHPNIRVTLISYCSPGIRQKLHYLYFCLWAFLVVLRTRADIVYASDAWSYPIAYCISFLPRVRVVLHEHDTPNTKDGSVNRLIGWFRKRLAGRAATCVIPQGERAKAFQQSQTPTHMHVVWNCPSIHEITNKRKPLASPNLPLKLWFHGSIVPTQLPCCIVEAMAKLSRPVELEFAGYETIGHPGYVSELIEHAGALGLGEKVRHRGAVPTRSQMYAAASQCDVGLALFAMEFREPMVGASNKPFDYLACGMALLIPDKAEWTEVFVKHGCALACNTEDATSIAEALAWFADHPEETRTMGERGRQLVRQRWNYESQFEEVLHFLDA